jgi:thiol:disulfide interchange protein DsbD
MNKKLFLFGVVFLLFARVSCLASDSSTNVVKWDYSAVKVGPDSYQLIFHARIAEGWKLFSVTMKDDQPNSRVLVDSNAGLKVLAVSENGQLQKHAEPVFGGAEIRYFTGEAEILVQVKLGSAPKDVTGLVRYMAIKKDSIVGPEDVPFRFSHDAAGVLRAGEGGLIMASDRAQMLRRSTIDLHNPVSSCGGTGFEDNRGRSLWGVFVLGFLGGLIALLTPCVFPMIPLTVSFFTKRPEGNTGAKAHAFLYGFFIFLIYILLSLPFHFLDSLNPEILNNISTNAWLNLFFFAIFIVFALSFFGLFEISLPAGLTNSTGAKSGKRGLAGIFFMALTLALVSFSCTGPILGSLLAGSLNSNTGALQLTSGMAGFGFALALPFALFALFPGWLNSLPKSGSWLNSVKIVLGFLELALAVKFLSNADLVMHWGLLKREVFFGLWIIIGLLLVLYLFGVLKFKHDPPQAKLPPLRIAIGIFFLAFTLYLVPGLFKSRFANRSLISGFPPPLSYSIYGNALIRLSGVEPLILNDYEKALELARQEHKPLLIDFTGWACVNCRKMEENVWTNPQVKRLIETRFILVSLYVDDRQKLPEEKQFAFVTSDGAKKSIRTIGDKFATLQSENFVNSSQPLYVILSPDEKLLNLPVGYTPSARQYASWLRCGLEAFQKPHS